MTSSSDHLGDTIQDLLDGRLEPPERTRAEAHLESCAECRRELEALRSVKANARQIAGPVVPEAVASAIQAALDREDRSPGGDLPSEGRSPIPLRPVLAFGVLLALLAAGWLVWRGRGGGDLPASVARDFVDHEAGRLPLESTTDDPRRLEEFFASKGVGFETRVFDLAMMSYRVRGGRVHRLAGRASAFFVYAGPGGRILVCEMFRARLAELPPGAAVRHHNGIEFRVYRHGGVTTVFWQEGEVVCVLASRGDPEEVIQLAFAKAVRVAARRAGVPARS